MGKEAFNLDVLGAGDAERAAAFFAYAPGGSDDIALRQGMETGDWTVVLARQAGRDAGGFYMNWRPKYLFYRRLDLPELQDLRVRPEHRRRGIATALIRKAEDMAKEAGKPGLGLSVGLYADYGTAQRLYARLGYEPDGQGVTYDRQVVKPGETRRVDDDLALMLLKFF